MIQKIHCVSSPLLDQKPLQFQFTHPADSNILCTAHVKNGKPVIEFKFPNGEVFEWVESNIVKSIARKYYTEKSEELNVLLKTSEIDTGLRQLGIDSLTLCLIFLRKDIISIQFNLSRGADINLAKEAIANLLDIKKLTMSPVMNQDRDEMVTLTTPDIQHIDIAIKQLQQLLQKMDEPQLGTVGPEQDPRLPAYARFFSNKSTDKSVKPSIQTEYKKS